MNVRMSIKEAVERGFLPEDLLRPSRFIKTPGEYCLLLSEEAVQDRHCYDTLLAMPRTKKITKREIKEWKKELDRLQDMQAKRTWLLSTGVVKIEREKDEF